MRVSRVSVCGVCVWCRYAYINCKLNGRVVMAWDVEVISVFNGFDQIQRFEFDSKVPSNVVCGDYTAATPPENGHVCLMYNVDGDSSTRIRACNSAGCGAWSSYSTVTVGGQEYVPPPFLCDGRG